MDRCEWHYLIRAENFIDKRARKDRNVEKEKLLIQSNIFFIQTALKKLLMMSKGMHTR